MKIRNGIIAMLFVLTLLTLLSCGSDSDEENGDVSDGKNEISDVAVRAYIVKIDGREVGYVSDKSELDKLSTLLAENKMNELIEADTEVIKVTVNSKLEGEETVADASGITSAEELAKSFYENGERISFSVTVSEKETKYVSFETVYKNSSSHYEGTKVVSVAGKNGERELVHHVTYTDGQESGRTLVSDTVTKKAVDEVVLVGTKKSTASTGKYAWPLKSVYITSSYGSRYLNGSYDFHLGVDLRASTGTSVYASDGGKVIYAGWLSSYGYLVKIQHDNGDQTYYAHLSKISVSAGNRVYKGQIIAKSGATGNVTGAHLHFEIRKNGSTVNPVSYLPSMRGVTVSYSAAPDSCHVQTESCLSRSVPRASLSSRREREAHL
ncbi:MAG: peptidoglycan DD-metalloendopeptidase family protein [Clostridia bacterium]|nr:peptidoglycan DD-metalloendopeptidase family protein [Clostridia bacterium]